MTGAKRFRRQRGMALMLVLWILALLTIMAGGFALTTRRTLDQLEQMRASSESLALAEGGVHYAMLMLNFPDPQQRWRNDGSAYEVELPAGRVRLRATDESGKIDLNAAKELTLKTFFTAVLADEDAAERLSDAILDWRDPDDLKRMRGAEADDYRAAQRYPLPMNRNFHVLEELLGVLGMTSELYAKIEPFVTIYSRQDGINPNKASPELLKLLFGWDERQLAPFLEARSTAAVLGGAPPQLTPLPGIKFITGGESAVTVSSEVISGETPGGGVEMVLKRGNSRAHLPFAVLHWKMRNFEKSSDASHEEAVLD